MKSSIIMIVAVAALTLGCQQSPPIEVDKSVHLENHYHDYQDNTPAETVRQAIDQSGDYEWTSETSTEAGDADQDVSPEATVDVTP